VPDFKETTVKMLIKSGKNYLAFKFLKRDTKAQAKQKSKYNFLPSTEYNENQYVVA